MIPKYKRIVTNRHLPYKDYLEMIEDEGLNCKAELYNLLLIVSQGESFEPFEKGLDNALKKYREKTVEMKNMRTKMIWFMTGQFNRKTTIEEEVRLHDLSPHDLVNEFIEHLTGSNVSIKIEE